MAWSGAGQDEIGTVAKVAAGSPAASLTVGETIVRVDPAYLRPSEVDTLLGDARRARERLQWSPKTSFGDMVAEMTEADLALAMRDRASHGRGLKVFRPDLEKG